MTVIGQLIGGNNHMRIFEKRALRGANYYHQLPVIFMGLELGELEERPSNTVPNFLINLKTLLPSLQEHTCSPGVVGGFFQRIESGTWAGHISEHVALELQNLIGHPVNFGKTFTKEPKGTYHMVYRYCIEAVGLRAGEMAVELVNRLFEGKLTEIAPLLAELRMLEEESSFGPSTQAIVDEATSRGISYNRLNKDSYVQLGDGKYQRRIEATLMDSTSAIGVEIAADKERTKEILANSGIAVSKGKRITQLNDAIETAESIGYPVVLKPQTGNHGRGVVVNIQDESTLRLAFEKLSLMTSQMIVEQHLEGFDYRLMVIDGKFVAAALRQPAYVIGDGEASISELIDRLNDDPLRGNGHEKVLTKVKIDHDTQRVLGLQNFHLSTVLTLKQRAYVKATANLSSGGTAVDVTETVHPTIKRMAERVSQLIGLNVMGIDLIADSLEEPLDSSRAGIIEVNAGPGFRMHLCPSEGIPRNIASSVIDMLFPEGTPHTVPICAITGTNGKTTTSRLITHILSQQGQIVGLASTDAVEINHTPILKGDYSGPAGAVAVLADQTIDYAVLEVARGGIIRRGLGFRECDVGVLLNVSSDHLGFGGIDTLEELTRLKSVVTESVKPEGYTVYNADDPLVMSRAGKTKGSTIYFSLDDQNDILLENLKNGRANVTLVGKQVVIQKPDQQVVIGEIDEFPMTFAGQAQFNVKNLMAAIAATYALGVPIEQIRAGVMSFNTSISQSPGRMNVIDIGEFKVVIDYGHNPGAIHATGDFFRRLMPGRKIRLASGVGNRREEDIKAYGQAVAQYFDQVILCDSAPRNRPLGETAEIVKQGMLEGGMEANAIELVYDEILATRRALEMAEPNDLVVLQADNIAKVTQDVLDFKREYTANQILSLKQ